MAREGGGYLQSPYNLAKKVKDVRIAVLAHKILYRWQTGKGRDVFVIIKDAELAHTVFVTTRTVAKFVDVLEEMDFLETKRGRGAKYYKINTTVARKYFNL